MDIGLNDLVFRTSAFIGRLPTLLAQTDSAPVPPADAPTVTPTTEGTPGTDALPGAEGSGNFLVDFFGNPFNLILISGMLFIMLVLRPQQRQVKELQKALADLKKNDRVITSHGIHGTIVQATAGEPVVTIRIDDNSGARMTINRDAISKIVAPETKE